MNLRIEPVAEAEIPIFWKMVEDYWWELMPTARGVRDQASRDAYFSERFHWNAQHEPPHWVLQDGNPIAFIHFSIDGSKAKIEDFYVDPSARRKGVGSQLVDWTTRYFDQKGVTQIDLTVRRDNPASLAFWESQGFVIGHHQMSMYRDPAAGTALKGALSSDFSEDELGYAVWRRD